MIIYYLCLNTLKAFVMKKIYALCLLLLAVGCKKDDSESLPLNAEKDILSFVFTLEDKPYTALIKGTDITVS